MKKKQLKFHIKTGDYFGTLATVLDFMRQDIERSGYAKQHSKLLKEKRGELIYFQKNYTIVKK
jgi:hypothetical protein